uniref:Uncharacterized protein n=1 Tax=viral metagenome TaxID=1070528 RepID=A0A6C0BM96_9ZZZZ
MCGTTDGLSEILRLNGWHDLIMILRRSMNVTLVSSPLEYWINKITIKYV